MAVFATYDVTVQQVVVLTRSGGGGLTIEGGDLLNRGILLPQVFWPRPEEIEHMITL